MKTDLSELKTFRVEKTAANTIFIVMKFKRPDVF